MYDLKNKSVLIAGGSGLIGKAIVQGFIDVGSNAVNGDISGGDLYLDAHSPNSLHQVINIMKHIDIFVNTTYPKDYMEHLFSYMSCAETIAAHMAIHGGGGVIINIASIYGIRGPDQSLYDNTDMTMPFKYAIVKGGVIAGTQWIACTYGQYGVRAVCISPGGIVDNQPKEFIERYCEKVPLGHMALPEDIVGPVLFLASDAARYVTGCNLVVDGGITVRI